MLSTNNYSNFMGFARKPRRAWHDLWQARFPRVASASAPEKLVHTFQFNYLAGPKTFALVNDMDL
jgi:hypothetical protein